MTQSRLDILPVASRRLRAALLLVFALGLVAISQTKLSPLGQVAAVIILLLLLLDGWRRTRSPGCRFTFDADTLTCRITDTTGVETELRCQQASVYPWIVVLQFVSVTPSPEATWLKRPVVFLPDSLGSAQVDRSDQWRRLLVWARLARRQACPS